ALVEQEPCLMHASIAENIRYARPEASDAEVADAARRASLEPFVLRLPEQYDTVVGERGAALSARERQRRARGRALHPTPAGLGLHGPPAGLDPANERAVAEGFEQVMRGRTTIVITHRAELARRARRVIALDATSGRLLLEPAAAVPSQGTGGAA